MTFISDRSACLAQSHYQLVNMMNKVQPYEVRLANTWEQPSEIVDPPPEQCMEVDDDEQTSKIFKLNEDCLLHLFKFLDLVSLVNMADVCKLFNRLLHQYSFPRFRTYSVLCHRKNTLAQTRRELLCIGRHISDLSFRADYDHKKEGNTRNHCVDNGRSSKFLKVIAQSVGHNIRRAYFNFGFCDVNRIATITPLLQNLESLQIGDWTEQPANDIDFPALCPNLIEFKVDILMPMRVYCKPWPSLRNLSVVRNYKLQPETLVYIFLQNPQLTCLEFGVYDGNYGTLFTVITNQLSGLEKLMIVINQRGRNNFAGDFNDLGELHLLREFTLSGLRMGSLKGIIDHLAIFSNLREIRLIGDYVYLEIRNYEQSLVNLAQKLSLLEELKLVRIPVKEETLVDIVRFSRKLKVLRIHDCKLIFSDDLIFKLVDAMKCHRQESNQALQLMLPKEDSDKLDPVQNGEFERYLQIKCP